MSEETIFNEVEEDLRSDRMQNLWRQYGMWVLGAGVLIVALVGLNEGWRWYQNDIAAKSSSQFYSAFDTLDEGDVAGAQEQLNLAISTGSGQYPVLAQFAQAAILAENEQVDEAITAYDALATTQSHPRLRELALMLAASLLVDQGDVAGIQARVGGLITPDNPLRNASRELLALGQYAAGDLDASRATFSQIVDDPTATLDLLRRVQLFVAQLEAEGAADPLAE